MPQPPTNFRFGPFELRTAAGELRKQGVKLKLRPQPYLVLRILIERAEQVVGRAELRDRLWSAETFVDFEQGLNTAIKELRAVLNDSSDDPRYIETLPKVGYRFIAPVQTVTEETPKQFPVQTSAPSLLELGIRESGASRGTSSKAARPYSRTVALGMTVALLAGLVAYWQWSRARAKVAPTSPKVMLAVLPFENLTGDSGQEYLSDGLTEEMIAQLGHMDSDHLGVIARTSVMHYKRSQEPLEQIGRELGVQYVLEGSVRRDAGRVRITAQLIRVKDQTHVWSRQFDRDLNNLLALQDEIAQEISGEIQLTLGDQRDEPLAHHPAVPIPVSYEAYDLYLQGRFFWNKRTPAGFQQAAEYFQRAIAKDPNYAPSYAGLADNFTLMSSWNLVHQQEVIPKARAAALKALQIDETLAEAHASLALIAENYDYDWQTAEMQYRRAIQLEPGYATAHQWYAEYLAFRGRFDEAFAEGERARQLDPLSLIIAADYGALLYFSRQYDRAVQQFRTVRKMEPDFPRAQMLVYAYVEQGRYTDALADIEARQHAQEIPSNWAEQAYVYGRWGKLEQAQVALAKFQQLSQRSQSDPTPWLLLAYAAMDNRKDEALALLERAYAAHSNVVTTLKVEPNYDRLRTDPRFQEVLRRVGLAQ